VAFQPPLNQIFIQSVASKVSAYRMGSGPLTAMSFTLQKRDVILGCGHAEPLPDPVGLGVDVARVVGPCVVAALFWSGGRQVGLTHVSVVTAAIPS